MMLLENDDCDPHEQRFEQMLQKYDAWTLRGMIVDSVDFRMFSIS